MNSKSRPRGIQKQAVDKLREAILAGVFKPGDRLVESELCEMLGISRPSVREALRSLEAEKLIATTPHKGTAVSVLTWKEAREIYQVRALLEGEAAALFAVRALPEHVVAMEKALAGFARAVENSDPAGLLRETARFYQILIDNCGNSIIGELLSLLLARISLLRDQSMSKPGRATHSLIEMREILRAIKNGDPTWARQAAVTHVENACEAARESYREQGCATDIE